jgi:hypothetical protein
MSSPGSSVVLVAALLNRMKADLTEDQWDAMIGALYALRIEGKPFDESALPSIGSPRRAPGATGIRGPGQKRAISPRAPVRAAHIRAAPGNRTLATAVVP